MASNYYPPRITINLYNALYFLCVFWVFWGLRADDHIYSISFNTLRKDIIYLGILDMLGRHTSTTCIIRTDLHTWELSYKHRHLRSPCVGEVVFVQFCYSEQGTTSVLPLMGVPFKHTALFNVYYIVWTLEVWKTLKCWCWLCTLAIPFFFL